MKKNKNKTKYRAFSAIGTALIVLPPIIYNCINYKVFNKLSDMMLVFAAMLGAAAASLSVLRKNRSKSDIYIILIGAIVYVLKDAVTQIGITLLLIGVGLFIHRLIFEKIAMIYKVRWYEESGRQVVYARSI